MLKMLLYLVLFVITLLIILFYYFNENYRNLVSDEILKGNFIKFQNKLNYSSFNQPVSMNIDNGKLKQS